MNLVAGAVSSAVKYQYPRLLAKIIELFIKSSAIPKPSYFQSTATQSILNIVFFQHLNQLIKLADIISSNDKIVFNFYPIQDLNQKESFGDQLTDIPIILLVVQLLATKVFFSLQFRSSQSAKHLNYRYQTPKFTHNGYLLQNFLEINSEAQSASYLFKNEYFMTQLANFP